MLPLVVIDTRAHKPIKRPKPISGGKTAIQKLCHWRARCTCEAAAAVAAAFAACWVVRGATGADPVLPPVGEWKTALTMVFSFTL
jgi:hypothetical protein